MNASSHLQSVLQQYPSKSSRKLSHVNAETDGCYRMEFPLDSPLETIRDSLSACPDIKVATLNHSGILAGTPNDPLWTDQWAWQKIDLPDAWDITKPNSTILVGIMDTGLDYTHEDLTDNVWTNPNEVAGNGVDDDGNGYVDDMHGWDFIDSDNDPQETTLDHGTRVAGVIAAKTYNGIGLAGIAGGWQNCPGLKLIGLSIAKDILGEGKWYQDEAVNAINYLTWLRQNYGYTVIANMSFQTDGLQWKLTNVIYAKGWSLIPVFFIYSKKIDHTFHNEHLIIQLSFSVKSLILSNLHIILIADFFNQNRKLAVYVENNSAKYY